MANGIRNGYRVGIRPDPKDKLRYLWTIHGIQNRAPPITAMTAVSRRVQRDAERFGDPKLSSRWSRSGRKALDPDPQAVFVRDPVSQTAQFML